MRASAYRFSQKLIGEGGVRLAAMLFLLWLARYLGAEDFGKYSTALAWSTLCVIVVDLGANAILTRELARAGHEARLHIARSSHLLKLFAAFTAILMLWGITLAAGFSPETRYLTLCLGVFSIGQAFTDYFSAILSGYEQMGWEACLKVVARVSGVAMGMIPLILEKPLTDIVTAMALGSLLGYATSFAILKFRLGDFGFSYDLAWMRQMMRSSWPLFASVFFLVFYESQDILLLNFFKQPASEIGYFSSAVKVLDVLRVYPVLLMGVFFPSLSQLHIRDRQAYGIKTRKLLIFMVVSLVLIAAGVYGTADTIIQLLYKEAYRPAAKLLQALMPALVVTGINVAQVQLLISQNRERKLYIGAALASLSNAALAAMLIPFYGTTGVCLALLGSEICYFFFLRNISHEKAPTF